MPKNTNSISIVSEPADGDAFAVGETVRFEQEGSGVISYACHTPDGKVVLGGGLIRGDMDFVVGVSQRWEEAGLPDLACVASLQEVLKGRTRVTATTTFEVRA